MKVLIISDGHGDVAALRQLHTHIPDPDMVLFGGDFAAFKQPETGLPFLHELTALYLPVFAVIGNCDEPSFLEEVAACGISIQNTAVQFQQFLLAGSGGGSKFTGATPNERTDEALLSDLHDAAQSAEASTARNLIIITHNPPHKTKLDKVAPLVHVGSPLIRTFIEHYQPLLAVSGHIHESYAIDRLNKTLLVNPGSLAEGRYAIAEISGSSSESLAVSAELQRL
ncbi:MAG: metallophosphoesterase family protein [Treponema sp.]